MSTTTNQLISLEKHFSLDQMAAVLMDHKNAPVGFFVSQELWDGIAQRFRIENGWSLGPMPQTFQGIKLAIDPAIPATEFDVAFTEEAWSKRLAALPHS